LAEANGFSRCSLGVSERKRHAFSVNAPPVTKIILSRLLRRDERKLAVEVHAGHLRHHQVAEDEIELLPARAKRQRFRSGNRGHDIVLLGEDSLHAANHQFLVVAATATGMRAMREVALEKVRLGTSTLQEVDRVLGEGISETPAIDQPRILLVDDDPTVRALARALLEKNGFRVTEVGDGPEAIEHFTIGEECALVVLDLNLPTPSGLEVLGRLRSSQRRRPTVGSPPLAEVRLPLATQLGKRLN